MIKDISQIFKEKHIEQTIWSLAWLLEINKLYPDDYYFINFKYIYKQTKKIEKYSILKIMDSSNWINLKFIEISSPLILSPDEFQFWWMMLRSSKTRFNLTSIDLKFNLLSECLTALSLCSGCPELKSVNLRYLKSDVKSKHEVVKKAKRRFRNKIGPIQKLEIW